jgi:uncharacterized protein (TIGR02452 family)
MSLAGVAKETLAIIERGSYRAPSGSEVSVRAAIDAAVRETTLYTPERLAELLAANPAATTASTTIDVTLETTAQAARRLAESGPVAALNFASAKNPGGGFVGGAKAQEEDLARCSALYHCQLQQRPFYDANRACDSLLYTDHMIHSRDVPFFRDERLDLLEQPFLVSIVTAPAPNAGEALRRDPTSGPAIREALRRRTGQVLALAEHQRHRVLVLGAWGCGVFRNDPAEVADAFANWLEAPRFRRSFEHVVFAIYDRSRERKTAAAFERRLAAR